MTGDPIPGSDYVVRYVRPGLIDGEDVDGGAFVLRPGETGLSINWLDYYSNIPKNQQLHLVRLLFRLTVARKGRFTELNVGKTKEHLIEELPALSFVEDPRCADPAVGHDADPSHAIIDGLPDPDDQPETADMIGVMIAECVDAIHPATE